MSTSHSYAAGSYVITVNLGDQDGTGVDSTESGNVSLLYSASGVLQPVNDTQAKNDPSVFKYGGTTPVKIRITDCTVPRSRYFRRPCPSRSWPVELRRVARLR